jgi:hypothetical protein
MDYLCTAEVTQGQLEICNQRLPDQSYDDLISNVLAFATHLSIYSSLKQTAMQYQFPPSLLMGGSHIYAPRMRRSFDLASSKHNKSTSPSAFPIFEIKLSFSKAIG